MPFILALLKEKSMSIPKQYSKEPNESLIHLKKRLETLLLIQVLKKKKKNLKI